MESLTSVHEVRQGDTLWKIGKDCGLNWRFLEVMNKETIKNPKLIKVGQKIIVPNKLFVRVIVEIYDLISCFCITKFYYGLILDVLLFFVNGGSITKNEIGVFCARKCLDANFSINIWGVYQVLGKSHLWAIVYDYISSFINYGFNKLIDCFQK
ncbi:LysM domain protein (macronuclear) [Tetrahymena thermophila SB210]|uniref:LysM domain protein n=1 Tax=Tetrahymena thermophila (strain SB210) TaxID=312017 RepID=Q22A37_TETTS|nr:LysM domain protein [Tetrahymena thermophila SB210]EAR82143.1 LysM domain protein [Tetrahymena thermophila SB210]|eukprot:XP_001029806.1 LysM domain protein [Tetrahymena thermophila SB210]